MQDVFTTYTSGVVNLQGGSIFYYIFYAGFELVTFRRHMYPLGHHPPPSCPVQADPCFQTSWLPGDVLPHFTQGRQRRIRPENSPENSQVQSKGCQHTHQSFQSRLSTSVLSATQPESKFHGIPGPKYSSPKGKARSEGGRGLASFPSRHTNIPPIPTSHFSVHSVSPTVPQWCKGAVTTAITTSSFRGRMTPSPIHDIHSITFTQWVYFAMG